MKREIFGNPCFWLLPLLLLALGGGYLFLIRPDVAGFFYDDGMYLMAAKSLAGGHGYRLAGMLGQPWFYKYPPLYSLCLALVLLVTPAFPGNIIWLKGLNVLFALGSLGWLWFYFRRQRTFPLWLCAGLLLLFGMNWRFIEVSIEMMSEPLFMLLSTAALVVATGAQQEKISKSRFGTLVLLGVAAFYTRTIGLVLVLALALWLFLRGERRAGMAYLLLSGAFMFPWFLWGASRPDTTYQLGDFLIRTFQETYFQSFRMDLHYEYTLPEVIGKGVQELLGNLSVQFFPLLERLYLIKGKVWAELPVPLLSSVLALFLGFRLSRSIRGRAFSPVGIYVGLYLLILPVWSFYDFYPRFLVVILPFMMAILIGFLRDSHYSEKVKHGLTVGLLAVSLLNNAVQLAPYLQKSFPNQMIVDTPKDLWADYDSVFRFIRRETPQSAILYADVTDEGYFYALNTGRTTLDIFALLPKRRLEQLCPTTRMENLLNCYQGINVRRALAIREVLRRSGATYLIYNNFAVIKTPKNDGRLIHRLMPIIPVLAQMFPTEAVPVFQSPDGWITVYRFIPEQANR